MTVSPKCQVIAIAAILSLQSCARTPASYTVHLEERINLQGATPALSTRIIKSVAADGSEAAQNTYFNPRSGKYIRTTRTLQTTAGVFAELSPDIKAFSASKAPGFERIRLGLIGDPARNCTVNVHNQRIGDEVGRETILGHSTVKLRTNDDRTSSGYQWRAPALNCEVLRRIQTFKSHGGTTHSISHLEATRVTNGNQSPEFFTIPTDYEMLSPQHYMRKRHFREHGVEPPPEVIKQTEMAEKIYQQRKFDPRSGL